jgi:hypothetical protein
MENIFINIRINRYFEINKIDFEINYKECIILVLTYILLVSIGVI